MIPKRKVAIFIDGSNLYHSLKKNFGNANLNFLGFAGFLAEKNKLVAAYYYNAPVNQKTQPNEYSKQQRFFSALEKLPYFEIKLGRLEKRPTGPPVEKGVDVRLAVDMVTHAYSNIYDIAILVSGDADFVPAIKAAQDFGKKVINICFPKTKSFHLNQICNETVIIDKEKITTLLWKK